MTTVDDSIAPTPVPELVSEPTETEGSPAKAVTDPLPAKSEAEPSSSPLQRSGDDWWSDVYDDQDADLDTHTGTVKPPLTRRLPGPTHSGEGGSPAGEGSGIADEAAAPGSKPESIRIPPRPTRAPGGTAPPGMESDEEPEEVEAAEELLSSLLQRAVREALSGQGSEEREEEAEPARRWSKLRSMTSRKPLSSAPPARALPGTGGDGGAPDSWARGLRNRRRWGLRYAPAAAGFYYFDFGDRIDPFLISSVVQPAGMIGSILAFTGGPAMWWLTRAARDKPNATRVRAVLSLSVSGLAYTWGGPAATGWLYSKGVDPSMWVPFGAGAITAGALWWFLDRRAYRWFWLFGCLALIPSTAVALSTARFVVNF